MLFPDTLPKVEKGLMRSEEGVLSDRREGSIAGTGPGRKRDVEQAVDGVWVKEN